MGLQTLYDTPSWEWPQGADELILRVLRDIVAVINEALAMTGDEWEAEDGDFEDDQW